MAGRSPARFLAPLALVLFAIALYAVVSGSTGDERESAARTATPAEGTTRVADKKSGRRKKRKTYTIKAGDTPSGIAEKVDVPLDSLLRLNPELDPQALAPGTRIRLR